MVSVVLLLLVGLSCAVAQSRLALNLFLIMDKSLSLQIANPHCQTASQEDCWPLAVTLAQQITTHFEIQTGGIASNVDENAGLCVSVMTVSCASGNPITKYLTVGCSTGVTEIEGAWYRMSQLMVPHGGTCPSDSLATTSRIIKNISSVRPVSLVLMLTDKDIDALDVQKTDANIQLLEDMDGVTFQYVPVGFLWPDSEATPALDTIKSSYNLTLEALNAEHNQNGGNTQGYTGALPQAPGLSAGAKAGIAIGVLGVVGVAFVIMRRRGEESYEMVI